MIVFSCNCGTQLRVGPEHGGRQVKCPNCQNVVTVPAEQAIQAMPVEPIADGPPHRERGYDEGYPPRRRERGWEDQRPQGPETSGKAQASLFLGIATFVFPILCAIPAVLLAFFAKSQIRQSGGKLGGAGMATTGLILGLAGNVTAVPYFFLFKSMRHSSEVASDGRRQLNDFRQIGMAMHVYNDTYKKLPTDRYSKDGKPLLSWRVEILPFIEQDHLYRQFKLEEPWDSPDNIRLLSQIPPLYRAPESKPAPEPHMTYIQVFQGQDAMFFGNRPIRLTSVTDGTSNTIMAAEAGVAVPWTKPADLAFNNFGPLPPLGNLEANSFTALMGDGSVRRVNRERVSDNTLRIVINPRDGQVMPFDWDEDNDMRRRW